MKLSIFSFFSGAGFLDLGFEKTGFEVVYANEIHPPFNYTYKYSREQLKLPKPRYGYHEGDIKELIEDEGQDSLRTLVNSCKNNNETVGFIGGPPCPDFSVGGKNRGREGENGKLSATYVELICQQKPDFFLFENVKGLWRTKKHRAFYDHMKDVLHNSGYVTTDRLINALEYGAPQDRARIILIGFKQSLLEELNIPFGKDMAIPDRGFPWEKHIKYSIADIFELPWPTVEPFEPNTEKICPIGLPEELTVQHWFEKNEVDKHPNANQYFTPRAGLKRFETVDEGDSSKKSYKRLHRWRYSPTACYGNNEVHLHPYKARRISVAEALAIQSLPKEYVVPPNLTLSNAFKTVGNGVPFMASKGIAETIRDFLGGDDL